MAEILTPIRYRAFLSYAHADTTWAKWLHAALEGFRIDKDLAGRATPLGPAPKTLRPIFRDREDFSGGHTLTEATIAALDASAALIVLCSTVAAGRPAVNEEVRLFRSRHPQRPVIPVIVEGMYPGNFVPALRYELASDGSISDRPITILGPDLRESGDGKSLGLAKVIAGLIGVPADDIFRRAERTRRRRNRFWAALAGVFLILAVGASGSAVFAWHQLKTNEAFLDATLERFTGMVERAVSLSQSYSVPLPVTLGFLKEAEGMLDVMARYGRPTPKLAHRKSVMLRAFADNYRDLGQTAEWESRIAEARRLLSDLVKQDPDNAGWAFELGLAHERSGDLLLAKGNLAGALVEYRARQQITERLAKADPNNPAWQRDLLASSIKIGDVLVTQGKLAEALASFRANHAIAERLAKADPNNAGRQRDLSVSYERVGGMLAAQGKLAEALAAYRYSLAIREWLAKADPNNARWQRDLSVSYEKVGVVLVAQGQIAAALAAFRGSAAIREGLVKADPNNAGWQRDLSVSYERVADVLVTQGKLAEALTTSHNSLTIMERLAKADPNNAGWQRGLSTAHERLGEVLVAQRKLVEALTSFRDSLTIRERLANADPTNAELQWGLVIAHWKLAKQGDEPARRWAFIVAEMRKLKHENRLQPDWASFLPMAEAELAKVSAPAAPR